MLVWKAINALELLNIILSERYPSVGVSVKAGTPPGTPGTLPGTPGTPPGTNRNPTRNTRNPTRNTLEYEL
jgi:hypothetical protein